ncbi:MAG: gluconolactonase, partial [Acidobacteriota bacterium]
SPDNLDWSGAGGMQVDDKGRLYVATAMGIQIADQPGRVQCIIPTPDGRVDDLAFTGPKRDTIIATSGDKTFERKFKIKGLFAWEPPTKPPVPGL